VTAATVNNHIVTRDVEKAADLTALVARYQTVAAPIANRVIGKVTADILRAANAAGESALGDVIADAQLAATAPASLGGAQIAFMNAGGIRADLVFNQVSGSEAPGEVTYGEMFTVQPFGNSMVTMTLNGAQIDALLEQQFSGGVGILQPSQGFHYVRSDSAPVGSKVSSITLNGIAISPGTNYRVTVNSFLADGGDNYTVLREGTDRLGGEVDTDALEKYFRANPSGVAPGPQNRITRVP
jgi:5'-nucleotidase